MIARANRIAVKIDDDIVCHMLIMFHISLDCQGKTWNISKVAEQMFHA